MILLLIMLLALFRFIAKKLILIAGIIYSFSGSTILLASILSMVLTGSFEGIIFFIASIFQITLGVVLLLAYSAIKKKESNQPIQEDDASEEPQFYRVEVPAEFVQWFEKYKKDKENNEE